MNGTTPSISCSDSMMNKKYCFANESEAKSSFSDLLSQVSADDMQLLNKALATIFLVRRELLDLVIGRSSDKKISAEKGLPGICIPANEDYVIPAFLAQGIGCCMELRQYNFDEIPVGLPRIHAYVIIKLGDFDLVVDVDADPFYDENVGVVISPEKTGLYSLGSPVHRRWVTQLDRIDKFEFYTRESCIYLSGEGISYLTMRYYFLESDASACPIVLSPFSTAYFSYSPGWVGTTPRDWIKLILVSNSQKKDVLLWNLNFDKLRSIKILFTEMKGLQLTFLDNTDILIPLDNYGYPLESETIQYVKPSAETQSVVKYSFQSSPKSKITLPSPFDEY